MKYLMTLIVAAALAGCQTNPAKTEQLILKVPPELMQKPAPLEKL